MGRVRDAQSGPRRKGGRRRDGRRTPSGWQGSGYEQDIHTPQEVANVVYLCLRGIPDLDPFGSPHQLLRASTIVCDARKWGGRHDEIDRAATRHESATLILGDGWSIDWYGRVYLNPEFDHLGNALERTWRQVHEGDVDEAILLGPIRTHRTYERWFWAANACTFLRPVTFAGWENGFSMPLGLSYYGPHVDTFCRFSGVLGRPRRLTPWRKRIMIPPMSDDKNDLAAQLAAITNNAIIEVARDNTHLSIRQIAEKCGLEPSSMEIQVLLTTPICDLQAHEREPVDLDEAEDDVHEAVAAANGARRRRKKAPTNKAKKATKKKAKAKTKKKGNGRATGSEVSERLGKFLAKKKKGATFTTSEAMEAAGVGRPATLKHLDAFTNIHMQGDGRGAHWVVQ